MVIINIANIISLLATTFHVSIIKHAPANQREIELHDAIVELLTRAIDNNFILVHEWELDFDDPSESHDISSEFADTYDLDTENYADDAFCTTKDKRAIVNLDYKRKAVQYWKSGKKRRLSLLTVQKNFKQVTSIRQLYRWEENIEQGGSHRDKVIAIKGYVLAKFQEALDRGSIIHDINLRNWALEAKEEVNLPTFKAGKWWIWHFKKDHRIVSRKITKFKTLSSNKVDNDNVRRNAEEFVENVKSQIAIIGEELTYNADESGFNLEIHSGRTLHHVGVKTVEANVQSLSSLTHSYTIMPIISASGQLISPLYVVLKEPSGTFGPRVQETLLKLPNIYIAASKSGKLTSHHFNDWFQQVYLENTGEKSLLLLDSWTGHCPAQLQQLIPEEKQIQILTIPKKTTGFIQPLDVFGFRIWKNFVRTFSDNVILNNYDVNLHTRNNIIRLQSLVHNQFSSPRFKNLFKYAWYKSGYISIHPDKFSNPVHFCYFKEQDEIPKCSICGKEAFIRCAWCKQYYCFEHFYEKYHYCNNYVE